MIEISFVKHDRLNDKNNAIIYAILAHGFVLAIPFDVIKIRSLGKQMCRRYRSKNKVFDNTVNAIFLNIWHLLFTSKKLALHCDSAVPIDLVVNLRRSKDL